MYHIMRKCVVSAALMVTGAAAFAATLVTEVSEPVRVGMQSQLSLIYDGNAIPQFVRVPKVDGLRWLSAGSRQSINQVNGNISRTTMCIYTFTVEKPGTYTIPATEVKAGNRTFTSKAVTFTATQPKLATSGARRGASSGNTGAKEDVEIDKLLFSRTIIQPESKNFYIGEEIPVEIQVYIARDLNSQVNWPEIITGDKSNIIFKDYQKQNPNNPKFAPVRRGETEIDGRTYLVYVFNTVLRPISAGKLELSSVTKMNIIVRNQQKRRPSSFFDDDDMFGSFFFNSNTRTVEHQVKSSAPQITVKPLPPRSGDARFLGLVGDWKVDASLSKSEAKVGEAVTLTVRITGNGTMETLSAPTLEFPNFRVYSPEVEKSASAGSATIKYILIPTGVGSHDLNFKFSTFNPAQVKYDEFAFVKNMKVEKAASVFSGAASGPGVIDGAADDAYLTPAVPEKRGPTGVLYLKKAPYEEISLPLWHNYVFSGLLVFFLGLAFWIGVELHSLRRRFLESDPGFQRRNAAKKNKTSLLNRLRASEPKTIPEMNGEIAAYVNDSLDLPPGSSLSESASIVKEEDKELAETLQALSDTSWSHAADSVLTEDFKMKLINQLSRLVCFALIFGAVSLSAAEAPAKADLSKKAVAVKVIDSPEAAMTAYDEGNFAGAEKYYMSLKKASAPSAKLFYNIGNCLYQQGKYAQALAYYESALRIAPRDSDILENLNLTRRKLSLPEKNVLEAPADVPPYLRDMLRPDEWLFVLCIGAALIFVSLGLRRCTGKSLWVSILAAGVVVMIISLTAVLVQGASSYDDRAAIVIVRNAPVYALPSTQALKLADINLQSGEEVKIVETRLDWVRIRAGAAEGWVKKSDVRKIWDL